MVLLKIADEAAIYNIGRVFRGQHPAMISRCNRLDSQAFSTYFARMKIVAEKEKMSRSELLNLARNMFGNLVKGVVDIDRQIMVLDCELHADEERILLEQGSRQENLWGINLYPELSGQDFIEFDSMINVRPSHGNRSRGVENALVREKIISVVNLLVVL